MGKLRILVALVILLTYNSAEACKYTIREIGYSTLSKVTYVLYRVDESIVFFPKQLSRNFSESNINGRGIRLEEGSTNSIVQFALNQKLSLPAYVLVAPDGRKLALTIENIKETVLNSPVRKQLLTDLPLSYGAVLLVDGKNELENDIAKEKVIATCNRIENILPNMPKQVDVGPKMIRISNIQFQQEKVMLWSLGLNEIPEHPIAYVVYGKGRIMGEKIEYDKIKEDQMYKLLSIIGADCECGLDRKWMLGYQIPLDWPMKTRQRLSDDLGFDVDNPMVLTEMSRILAIENKVSIDPNGVSFEPIIIDLDAEFDDVPEINHLGEAEKKEDEIDVKSMMLYSFAFLIGIIGIVAIILIRRGKHS